MTQPVDNAYALILAGGGGTRLWPSSRRARPKQFLTLGGSESLIAASFRRAAAVFGVDRTLIVTAEDQANAVRAALPDLPPANLIAEPAARNTAAAVGLGAVHVVRRSGPSAILAVLPSDAFIGDESAFSAVLHDAVSAAGEAIVTIGVRPTAPETGYGYLQLGPNRGPRLHDVAAFVEKPDHETALRYLSSGTYLWNSGMFFFTAARLLEETRRHLAPLGAALDNLIAAPDLAEASARIYPGVPAISIDFGIMEKATGIRVVPGTFGWNDVGSWASLGALRTPDEFGNVSTGDVMVRAAHNNIVVSEPGAPFVGAVGVDDLVIVATPDAVLVTHRARAQDVRLIVDALKSAHRKDLL